MAPSEHEFATPPLWSKCNVGCELEVDVTAPVRGEGRGACELMIWINHVVSSVTPLRPPLAVPATRALLLPLAGLSATPFIHPPGVSPRPCSPFDLCPPLCGSPLEVIFPERPPSQSQHTIPSSYHPEFPLPPDFMLCVFTVTLLPGALRKDALCPGSTFCTRRPKLVSGTWHVCSSHWRHG